MNRQCQLLSESDVLSYISRIRTKPGVFLETSFFDEENHRSFLFTQPHAVLTYSPERSVDLFFRDIERYRAEGFWIAGYLAYEFGFVLEPSFFNLLQKKKNKFPLAWFGIFEKPVIIDHRAYVPDAAVPMINDNRYVLARGKLSVSKKEYKNAINRIKQYLKQGETYQVNYTQKYLSEFHGDAAHLYLRLRKNQSTSYSGFINDGNRFIASFSPELFFHSGKESIVTRPMKGTYKRGRDSSEDEGYQHFLQNDAKNRAENIMIVDLLRNDLGKIAQKGSVQVTRPFTVEVYPSLLQMTSTINARMKKDVSVKDIFSSLFPSGSVTGAPKINTMKLISTLEKEPRGVYTGAIGFISPEKEICFNVAIRTLIIDGNRAEFGVGSGIVADSGHDAEYNECLLKTKFLHAQEEEFSLIETLLWERGAFAYEDLHLERLKRSCAYFNVPVKISAAKEILYSVVRTLSGEEQYSVRLLIDKKGICTASYTELKDTKTPVQIVLSSKKVNSRDVFLFHKTTCRALYERERKKALKQGFFDVIFINEKNELTEGAISNIFLEIDGILTTPKLSSGLLPGILRQDLLNKKHVVEKLLYPKDFKKATNIFIGNSVRGLIPAVLKK